MERRTLWLASSSSRRRELLAQLGLSYQVVSAAIDETPRSGEVAPAFVERMALEKGRSAWRNLAQPPSSIVVAADTEVVVDNEVLGKPTSAEHGRAMLQRLSGRSHMVMSGVAVISALGENSVVSESRVTFRVITPAEIDAYWSTGEPADKAGGYAIQGIGAIFIADLQGSYSGVMGLPLFETALLLRQAGIVVL